MSQIDKMVNVENSIEESIGRVVSFFNEKNIIGRELDFFKRIYAGGINMYLDRLKAISFSGLGKVLDAGSGYGQWAIAMSLINDSVIAVEKSRLRCDISDRLLHELSLDNLSVVNGSITEIPLSNESQDAVFSYSTIYQTNWKKSLREFYRVLKKGGRLYLSANGLGWSLFNLLENPNPSSDFSSRWNALRSLIKTLSLGMIFQESDWILFPSKVKKELISLGFDEIKVGGDGTISDEREMSAPSFYNTTYHGISNVFEVLAVKNG